MQLPIASNYNILIADKRGKMVVVECTPNIKKIGEAKSVDDGYLVCTVNSFISDKLKPYDFAKGDDYHSYTRYSVVMDNCINNVKNNDPVVETQKLLKGEYGFMCQYDDEPDFETIWSSIFDLSNLMIYRAEGDPRRKKFITDKRLHNIVIGRKDAEKWIRCPVCGSKTRDRLREDTVLKNYPLYCPKCKQDTLVNAKELYITVIKEPDAQTQSQ